MDERINRVAALANMAAYDSEATRKYVDGAPHIKHESLRKLYGNLVVEVYDYASKHTKSPKVLDLGAGEGSVTLPFLELGATVTAVDISKSQLDALRSKSGRFIDKLEVRCEDIAETIKNNQANYDIIVTNSFLHHIPDYLGMITEAINLLTSWGQFFSFQDPLRYDSLGKPTLMFSQLAYFSWRVFQGDLIEGIKRNMRRKRGIYLEDSIQDNAEYHVARNGVDQDAIYKLFEDRGFNCSIIRYFSTQNPFFQSIGSALGVNNMFAVIAQPKMIK